MYHFIINPHSKTGKGGKYWKALVPVLDSADIKYQVHYTKRVGHATELVREISAKNEFPLSFIILGGDGTLNEAVQGIIDFENTYIGYIPTGSSNDFARDLKMSPSPAENLKRILSVKEPISCDLGELTILDGINSLTGDPVLPHETITYRFDVSSDLGFGAAVCAEALTSKIKTVLNKFGLGKLTYAGIALRQVVHAKKPSAELIFDDDKKRNVSSLFLVGAFIRKFEGGGMMFAPSANATDGLFDVCLAENLSTGRILRLLPTVFSGKHVSFPEIEIFRCSTLEIKTSEYLWIHTDGEVTYKAKHVSYKCLPGALKLLW